MGMSCGCSQERLALESWTTQSKFQRAGWPSCTSSHLAVHSNAGRTTRKLTIRFALTTLTCLGGKKKKKKTKRTGLLLVRGTADGKGEHVALGVDHHRGRCGLGIDAWLREPLRLMSCVVMCCVARRRCTYHQRRRLACRCRREGRSGRRCRWRGRSGPTGRVANRCTATAHRGPDVPEKGQPCLHEAH